MAEKPQPKTGSEATRAKDFFSMTPPSTALFVPGNGTIRTRQRMPSGAREFSDFGTSRRSVGDGRPTVWHDAARMLTVWLERRGRLTGGENLGIPSARGGMVSGRADPGGFDRGHEILKEDRLPEEAESESLDLLILHRH